MRPVRGVGGRSREAVAPGFGWRLGAAGLLLLSGAGMVISSLLNWLVVPTDSGGVTLVNGWGTMSGGGQDGYNLNDLMSGYATFRPGLWPTVCGPLVIVCAVILAVAAVRAGQRDRAHPRPGGLSRAVRMVAVIAFVLALVALGWSIYRLRQPDAAGVLEAGDGGPGDGQWVSLAAALIGAVAAVLCWGTASATPVAEPAVGIQP